MVATIEAATMGGATIMGEATITAGVTIVAAIAVTTKAGGTIATKCYVDI
ncbi:MAG: hypothetical protein ACR2Q4_11680 [Geminicoccaceae bacterium]